MVRFDSWRAVSTGNGADRNLATKSTHGGRAIRRAVTRVKFEQAPKAAMWTPTRPRIGEGRMDREEPGAGARPHDNHRAPMQSAGVVNTARRKGTDQTWGAVSGANRVVCGRLVILRGKAAEALSWAQATLTRLGLTLNEWKT